LHKKPEISIIICTHNRAATLNSSLEHYKRLSTQVPYEVLVVVNACTDDTLEVVKQNMMELPQLSFVLEPNIGLSNARNSGLNSAKAPFIFYIDDDAYPNIHLIDNLSNLLKTNDIKCISGNTKYWDQSSPKWIKASLVEVSEFRKDFGKMPRQGYVNGCACGFSKSLLLVLGGFDPKLGMNAKNIGYYDEIAVQKIFEAAGHTIYFDPSLIVYHQSHSKTVVQFLQSSYYKGKYRSQVKQINKFNTLVLCMLNLIQGLFMWIPYRLTNSAQISTLKSFQKASNYLGQTIQ
jgi:glycosyltransferase involved in cell wall biosynthesis